MDRAQINSWREREGERERAPCPGERVRESEMHACMPEEWRRRLCCRTRVRICFQAVLSLCSCTCSSPVLWCFDRVVALSG